MGVRLETERVLPSIALHPGMRIHLIGIAGAGLSAIAQVLLDQGIVVSGSDLNVNAAARALARAGARIYQGHRSEQVNDAQLVLVSSAVPHDNVELRAARRAGIPTMKRDRFLGLLTKGKRVVAVAGTHGKTTTTAMIATMLLAGNQDPSFIVGGIVAALGKGARAGAGPDFVIEADEYDQTFLGLKPQIAVVTNVEWDHVDCYPTPESFWDAFVAFSDRLPDDGTLIACHDDPGAWALGKRRRQIGLPVITYGLTGQADWQAAEIHPNEVGGNSFIAVYQGETMGEVVLRVPGRHNVANALAALAAACEVDLDFGTATSGLRAFAGTGRRLEWKGEVQGITVFDDYAHHPTEVRATLAALRERFPRRPIWAVFQPHTFSRARAFASTFARSFGKADHVVITDIYAARERDLGQMHSTQILAAMQHPDARYIGELADVATYLVGHLEPDAIVVTLGAGDGYQVGEMVLARLRETNR
ncbi:MAG TPA: UDP-N-acetylmuramate--L-alanine ligase [Anaerolineae bacterium]|nr:UDP-N-acetylmuramate--L-alanine ligase [Anaerolineae bacterium]HIQ04341.1 UDP-N-acetylmuramate--L-alanine ligase [Anaerolineae bacterium]